MQQGGQQDEVMQIIQMFAQMSQMDPAKLMQQLQQMPPEEQQQAIQQMAETLQQGGSQQPDMMQAAMMYGGYTTGMFAEGGEPNGGMALGQMSAVADKMSKLRQFVSPEQNLDPWIASKLAIMDDSAAAISDYMMYNPEAQGGEDMMEQEEEMPEMGNGGYTVTRSSDRKGKTHKVTGPDGTVKYFGDSNLGQHPGNPKRKAAFYARHKKNLAGNPFFRAFARKTWEEGGQTDDDREMLSGVADMLRRVNDVNNRKQIANYMMDNFRDENVTFEPNKFLRSANAFGNNTPKAQTGREVKKKYVIPQNLVDFNNRLMAEDEATKKANLDAMRQYYINSGQPYFTENKSPREKAEPWTDPVLDRIDRENNEKYADRDSGFENFLEFIDPTGISSWDDVGRTFRNPSASNMERGFALFSALPIVGKLGKLAKGTKAINTAVKGNALQKIGRGALKGVDIVTGGPAMRYFDQTLNPLSRGFGTLTEKAVGQIPYSGVRKAFEIGSDFNQMRRFQDAVLSPGYNYFDKYMTQPANSQKPWWQQ